MPIFTAEIFPMPKIEEVDPTLDQEDPSPSATTKDQDWDEEVKDAERTSAHPSSMSGDGGAAHLGSDLFNTLSQALSASKLRLVDVFNEADKDSDGALNTSELFRFLRRLAPEAGPKHARYLQLMLGASKGNEGPSLMSQVRSLGLLAPRTYLPRVCLTMCLLFDLRVLHQKEEEEEEEEGPR